MKKAMVAIAGLSWLFQISACSQRPAPLSADAIPGEPAVAGTPLAEEAGVPDFRADTKWQDYLERLKAAGHERRKID